MANLTGILSSKEGFPLVERTPSVLGPSASRSSWRSHLFSFPGLCTGRRKTRQRALCSLDNSFWQRGARSQFLPPLNACGNNQKRAKTALLSFLTSLGQFQGPLQRPQLGSQEKTNGKGSTSYSRNKELLPKGREREGCVDLCL